MTRQYYYRANACLADNPRDPGCICWHDEGTESLDSTALSYLSPVFEDTERGEGFTWRDKPAANPAPAQPEPKGTTLDEKSPVKSPAEGSQEDAPVLEDDLAHEAEMSARAAWREGADLDDIELDELDEPYEEEECSRCRGDGRDPWNDYLLPCPECQGEQQP